MTRPKAGTVCETARTRLRTFSHDDLDALAEMVADQEQMTFYPRPKTRDEAYAWIERNQLLYREHGFRILAIESIVAGFLGYCGIRPLTIEKVEEIEMGWHTRRHCWGRGIATEAALACRDLAFTRFGIERLVATIDPTHTASLRVADKIGMSWERQAVLADWPCVVYAIEHFTRRADMA